MAVAAYLDALRTNRLTKDGRKYTQKRLADALGIYLHRKIDQSTISRAMSGEDIPAGDMMAALLDILGGRLEDVAYLLKKKHATDADGRQRAIEALAADIPSENELERLIADWHADEALRRSLRRAWHAGRANTDVD